MYRKLLLVLLSAGLITSLFAQQNEQAVIQPAKYALVIGNGNYASLTPLANPVNDANDISAVLQHLGFTVDKVLNGNLEQMEGAVQRLKDRLTSAEKGYGFFFYAGHGVQSGGENFLIPVNANIPNENYLRNRSMSVQQVLDDLNDARNGLNVIVLDACRDNPFGWGRSASRGLSTVSRQPADSIIVYATSAGQQAADGDGRNGLFTSQLISNLATPGLEVNEVFRRTGQDVTRVSKNSQVPAIYSQFFGTAFLGVPPENWDPSQGTGSTTIVINRDRVLGPSKLWSISGAVGSSFGEPLLTGTLKGTVAPFGYSFLEAGLTMGFVTIRQNTNSYYSITPYIHYNFFWPFSNKLSVYAGAGLGYRISSYNYFNSTIPVNALPLDASVGILLLNFLDVSYTFSYPLQVKTSFTEIPIIRDPLMDSLTGKADSRFSVGYTYRFTSD